MLLLGDGLCCFLFGLCLDVCDSVFVGCGVALMVYVSVFGCCFVCLLFVVVCVVVFVSFRVFGVALFVYFCVGVLCLFIFAWGVRID